MLFQKYTIMYIIFPDNDMEFYHIYPKYSGR